MFILSLLQDPINTLGFILGLFVAITIHEFIHAWTAFRFGDETAKLNGRLSLNPFVHLDPWGTLFLLMTGFGWGKPVPVNPSNFKNPRWDEFWVALSGPSSNLVLASLFALLLRLIPAGPLFTLLVLIIQLNLVLCVFNLLPIPPLDGSKILWVLFPQIDPFALEQTGVSILFAILILSFLTNYPILSLIISPIISFLARLLGVPLVV